MWKLFGEIYFSKYLRIFSNVLGIHVLNLLSLYEKGKCYGKIHFNVPVNQKQNSELNQAVHIYFFSRWAFTVRTTLNFMCIPPTIKCFCILTRCKELDMTERLNWTDSDTRGMESSSKIFICDWNQIPFKWFLFNLRLKVSYCH